MYSWVVIIYDPVGGFSNHSYVSYSGGAQSWFRQELTGGKSNIVIHRIDTKAPHPRKGSGVLEIFRMKALEDEDFGQFGVQNRSWDNLENAIAWVKKHSKPHQPEYAPKLIWAAKAGIPKEVAYSQRERVMLVNGPDYDFIGIW